MSQYREPWLPNTATGEKGKHYSNAIVWFREGPGHGAACQTSGLSPYEEDIERAERIVACVNACRDIPTEDLLSKRFSAADGNYYELLETVDPLFGLIDKQEES